MIVLVSLIVLVRRLILVSTIFRMVHPYITVHSVELFTLVSRIFVKLAPVARMCKPTALRLAITC